MSPPCGDGSRRSGRRRGNSKPAGRIQASRPWICLPRHRIRPVRWRLPPRVDVRLSHTRLSHMCIDHPAALLLLRQCLTRCSHKFLRIHPPLPSMRLGQGSAAAAGRAHGPRPAAVAGRVAPTWPWRPEWPRPCWCGYHARPQHALGDRICLAWAGLLASYSLAWIRVGCTLAPLVGAGCSSSGHIRGWPSREWDAQFGRGHADGGGNVPTLFFALVLQGHNNARGAHSLIAGLPTARGCMPMAVLPMHASHPHG